MGTRALHGIIIYSMTLRQGFETQFSPSKKYAYNAHLDAERYM